MSLTFRATIKIRGINPYVGVSAVRARKIKANWRKPMPVMVRVNGAPETAWRINMMPAGDGSFYLYLHGDVRAASKTGVGDTVTVELAFDAEYRGGPMEPMPDWLHTPLKRNRAAARAFAALTPSRQKEIVRYMARLESSEARERNVQRVLEMLTDMASDA
jgi:bacteriocin resistance YdeI/OmpD-like protein/uncharacterized protein DUF1905